MVHLRVAPDLLFSNLYTGYNIPHVALTLSAMFTLVFFGFLRCSPHLCQILIRSAMLASQTYLNTATTSWHSTSRNLKLINQVTLHWFSISKTYPLWMRSVLFQTLNYRRSNSLSLSYPFFLSESIQAVSCSWFHYHLPQILIQSGISPSIFVQTIAISELHRFSFINWIFWGLTDAQAPLQTSKPPHTKNTSYPCHSFSPTNK